RSGDTAYGGQLATAMKIEDLRALLDTRHQEQRLNVKSVQRSNEEGTLYGVEYADGTRQLVQLANNPVPGGTKEAQEQAVRERAEILLDWSVEQIFLKALPNEPAQEAVAGNASP